MQDRPRMPAHKVSDARQVVPQVLLQAMAALVVATLAVVSFATLTGQEPAAQAHARPVAAEKMIQIKARADGGTAILDAEGEVLVDTAANRQGFITVVRNAMEFERHKHRIEGNPPVALIRFADGRLGLRDDATGWKIGLIGFGQDNAKAWAALIR